MFALIHAFSGDRLISANKWFLHESVIRLHSAEGAQIVRDLAQLLFDLAFPFLYVDARRRKVELLAELDIAASELSDVLAAIDLHRLHGFSFWDEMIVHADKQTGCGILFSEVTVAGVPPSRPSPYKRRH